MKGRVIAFRLPPTHMIRACDDSMSPVIREGFWLGVRAGNRPLVGSEWIFTNRADGSTMTGLVAACGPDGWRLRQWNPRKYRYLSRSRWRATWRIRYINLCRGDAEEYHRARAIGDYDRAEKVLLARAGMGPMPEPLPAGITVPNIYPLSETVRL